MKWFSRHRVGTMLLLLILGGLYSLSSADDPSPVRELRIQTVGDVTYFHVRLDAPREMLPDVNRFERGWWAEPSPSLAPRLVADGKVRLVCQRFDRNQRNRFGVPPEFDVPPPPPGDPRPPSTDAPKDIKDSPKDAPLQPPRERRPRQPAPVQGLEFVGQTDAKGEVKFKLIYPVEGKRLPVVGRLRRTPPPPVWKEKEITLDFGKARVVAVPKEAAERKEVPPKDGFGRQPPARDDLEGLWAVAQTEQFLDLDNEVSEFGFYSFAATALARKYGVPAPPQTGWRWNRFRGGFGDPRSTRELFEMTTGVTAITESLQLRRMNGVASRDNDTRSIPIAKVQGIDIAEHPWEKMMGEKKPAPEPFARLVPDDNYYVHFRRFTAFNEFTELFDRWGTALTRTYEPHCRDHRLRERYEQQLCLRSTLLGKALGPLVIKGLAVTGSDLYVREGTDVAILFQVVSKDLFLSAVSPFLEEARKKFGDRLKEEKDDYKGIKIESFVTPLREVSLHRAAFDDFVVYANSPAGLRRVLDAHKGEIKRLADSLDFQYMRTIFRADDKEEDGFAFLSDPFIRNLVGPASKIKERRRLEALVSLHMLTHGAMLTSWETGKAPVSTPNILNAAGLKKEELPMPEGKPAFWDPEHLVARSDVYNTLHFATPLIELPMDNVTRTEAEEYNRFRLEYLGLWRQFFDPIGMRVALKEGQVQLDTYILPLIENSSYNQLRRVTGQKTVRFDPARIPAHTLGQYLLCLSGDRASREWLLRGGFWGDEFGFWGLVAWALDPVGDWFLVRVNDSEVFEKLVKLAEKQDQGEPVDVEDVARLVWTMPVAVGFDVKNGLTLTGALTALRTSALAALPGALTWEPLEKEYKGVSIVRVQATRRGRDMLGPILRGEADRKDPFLPAVYYASINGSFFLTLNEEMMRQLIDSAAEKPEGKGVVEAASSLHLAPGAAEKAAGLLRRMLEHQTFDQARNALPVWYALHRCGIVAPDAKPEQARDAAYRYLGYVPVSPDGAVFRYDREHDEVVNERHGSNRKPALHKTTADDSPLNYVLEQVRAVRADLRFREDGIHTVLTIQRSKKEK
jgi:hypothetical protein